MKGSIYCYERKQKHIPTKKILITKQHSYTRNIIYMLKENIFYGFLCNFMVMVALQAFNQKNIYKYLVFC